MVTLWQWLWPLAARPHPAPAALPAAHAAAIGSNTAPLAIIHAPLPLPAAPALGRCRAAPVVPFAFVL